ncbi:methyl-CPG-binding domain protein 13 [Striga asiatica]|uniref:Methyl-CPG-binding domain protein 13 n=1 Tax=Striga asiatica TaxID=4170 RepID=A0A5A7PCB2_STRAF|nr:methyl-CPG-binding domain protein 13 [Striga asiatica]
MVVGKSPEWLPSGFTEKVKYRNGRRIKYYYNDAMGTKYYSKKDVLSCAKAGNGLIGTLQSQTSNDNDKGIFSSGKVEAELDTTDDSPKWLPNGWTVEKKTRERGSTKGSMYKVYTDVSTGSRFYSRAAVTRYLNSLDHAVPKTIQNKCDSVDVTSSSKSQPCTSMTNTDDIPEEKKESITMTNKVDESLTNTDDIQEKEDDNSSKTLDIVDKPSALVSQLMTSPSHTLGKKKKCSSFIPVATERIAADDLPPGWIKEIVTSKSGSKIRKDPYYIDPVNGYAFRSKPDALRYVSTNDIRNCAIKPKKRESSELNLIKNGVQSSIPAHDKLSEQTRQPLVCGESNRYGESSDIKPPLNSETKLSKQTIINNDDSAGEANCLEPENKAPENEPEQQPPKSETKQKTEKKPPSNSKNPKKRKDPIFPSRASKRLSGTVLPETPLNSVLNERSLKAAAKRRPSTTEEANISPKSPAKVVVVPPPPENELSGKKTPEETQPPNFGTENPANNASIGPEEQTGNNNTLESQLCFDFGDSWSDPLEFALKTLKGEISIDDTLAAFPGCFNENLNVPCNNNNYNNNNQLDGILGPQQSHQLDLPDIFGNDENAPGCGSSGKESGPDPLQGNSSDLGNVDLPLGFSWNKDGHDRKFNNP